MALRAAGTASEERLRTTGLSGSEETLRAASSSSGEEMLSTWALQWIASHNISPYCDLTGSQGIAGISVAGCAHARVDLGLR